MLLNWDVTDVQTNINQKNNAGQTSLHIASCRESYTKIIITLLYNGSDPYVKDYKRQPESGILLVERSSECGFIDNNNNNNTIIKSRCCSLCGR